jgi:CheY-like chemotaxis protein
MSDFDVVPARLPVTDENYGVACWKCGGKFNAASSPWCACDSTLRTLQCPHCASCICKAPFGYKRTFWNDAPRVLREHTHRFRVPARATAAPGAEQSRRPDESAYPRPHVLIVDDEEPIRSLAACYVEQMGYQVTTVDGPEEALLITEATSFDVVLTDALMPKMDGRELCRTLKEAHGNDLKVILMTSLYTATRFRTEARHLFKVDEYLAKPLRYAELRDALQRVAPLARRAADRNAVLLN